MNTTMNNISFNAKIQTLVKSKNPKAFQAVCQEFEKMTSKYPNETLYITRNKTGAYSWHISDKKSGDYFKGEEIFTNSVDEHIEELGVKKFAKELVNAFKAMKLERQIYKQAKPIKIELDKTSGLSEAYRNIALTQEKDGNNVMAKRYFSLSERFTPKMAKLKMEYDKCVNSFNSKKKQYSKDFPELTQVELYLP